MAYLAMTSPLAPVVAALEGLRRRHPELLACIVPGLIMDDTTGAVRGTSPRAVAVLTVAGWKYTRRVPLLSPDATYLNQAGQLGIRRADVAVLEDDPAAGRPGVIVVRNKAELLALLYGNLTTGTPGRAEMPEPPGRYGDHDRAGQEFAVTVRQLMWPVSDGPPGAGSASQRRCSSRGTPPSVTAAAAHGRWP